VCVYFTILILFSREKSYTSN